MACRECFDICKVCRVFTCKQVKFSKTRCHKTPKNKLHTLWVHNEFQRPLAIVYTTKTHIAADSLGTILTLFLRVVYPSEESFYYMVLVL